MSLVIGISGAQGAGKSTLLAALGQLGWRVDDFKVSRAVQAEMGCTGLQAAIGFPEIMVDFQEKIFQKKLDRDEELHSQEDPICLVERTFADLAAYAALWVHELDQDSRHDTAGLISWLTDYTRRCARAQEMCYGGIILLPLMPHVEWQVDPRRAARASASYVFETIENFIRTYFHDAPQLTISSPSIEERAREADVFLRSMIQEWKDRAKI